MLRALPLCLLLIACSGDVPEVHSSISAAARGQPFPTIAPIDDLLAEAARPSRAQAAEGDLRARSNRLSGRGIAGPGTGSLEARGQRLRERAAALRALQI